MKSFIVHSLVVVILILLYSCNSGIVAPEKFRLSFAQDSGYISSGDALRFLLAAELIDTIGGTWEGDIKYSYLPDDTKGNNKYYKSWLADEQTDTIGKYYAFSDSGNYIVALSLGSDDLLLLELTPQSDVVHCDLYGHGSHPCCWNSLDDMLKRYGSYFGISTCGTGSAYCSSNLHLFKDRTNPKQHGIPVYEYAGALGEIPGHILTSNMQFVADSILIVQYELEKFTEDYNAERKNISTCRFTVKFVYRNNNFETDSLGNEFLSIFL